MTANQLNQVFDEAAKSLDHCIDCGMKCILRYDPGVTYIYCLGCKATKRALPDWQPETITDEWND